ncbi:MAG TPA: serine/threonine-protein kinase [Gammaproteobacteria bacterium]|nr:serine/threonine-protein kinase [Gammaproteobacteria bacterium]
MFTVLTNKTLWGLLLVLLLSTAGVLGSGRSLERGFYRFSVALSSHHSVNPQVAVVAIDDASVKKYGPWPWPRRLLAALVDKLTDAKAQVVALGVDLSAPQNAEALDYLGQLKAVAAAEQAPAIMPADLSAKLDEAQAALSTDAVLAASIARSGHVVLAAPGQRDGGVEDEASSSGHWRFALQTDAPTAPHMVLRVPQAPFLQGARGVGFLDDEGEGSLDIPLLVRSGGQTLPSLGLLTATQEQGNDIDSLSAQGWSGVQLGDTHIPTDRHMQVLLHDAAAPVPIYGFDEVMTGAVQPERLAGKAVLVGRVQSQFPAAVVTSARLVSGLLNGDLVAAPYWVWGVRGLVTLLVGLYLLFLMPRLSLLIGAVVSGFLLIALLNGELVPLLSQSLWVPLALPLSMLVLGHGSVLVMRFVNAHSGVSRGALSEVNRELGLAYQALNRFDQAFSRFKMCLPSKMLCDNLMALGQELERGRRYSQAVEVYEHVQKLAPAYADLEDRLERLRQLNSSPSLAGTSAGAISRAIATGGVQKPMLGRYELVKELGRGAMGVVYLGKDAKIGRQVAIKTMALSDEFDGATLKEAHDRFFREAETAGRMNHPNIVTIYDVGEDQGLAYIAMDFLSGDPLQKYTTSANLLPMGEVVAVVLKIAEALDFAHKHHVVHRDIKPANIMYDRESGRVKITDFGIAALTDLSKTKTGTILGSPLYMSPEQVSGKKVDGRSDLYSLGVSMYQLLRGELPYEAASLTGLLFKIANEPHPDVTFLRPDIPPTVKIVIDRALQKDPDQRFQTGMEMANALRLCLGVRKRSTA